MKKVINSVLAFLFIAMQMTVALYPTIKKVAKVYVDHLDLESLQNVEQLTEDASLLSEEEKAELVNMMSANLKNALH
ncbi:hypothetical protein [Maribacter sp. 2307UL18-2]|uniref:hypothetical protein n=1 Tax=Maribacter sp. 2307UL18-2 TaxID=3386274 RepID=UPI0039BD7292